MVKTLNADIKVKPHHCENYFDLEDKPSEISKKSFGGGLAMFASQWSKFILQMVSTMILARILRPEDFGLLAMVTVLTNFALMFRDMGLSTATIQKATITHEQVSYLFWINVLTGLIITILLCSISPLLSLFYGEPRLTLITISLAGSFLVSGLGVQHQAILRRQMRFKTLAIIEIVSNFGGVLIAIVLAYLDFGYWCLIFRDIFSQAIMTLSVWLTCSWKPGIFRHTPKNIELLKFGINITGFNIVNYFTRNMDNLLLGKVWGASVLGIYSRAYSILMLPIYQIRNPIFSVAIPGLSRLQNEPEKYRNYFDNIVIIVATLTMPLSVFLLISASEVVDIILGPKWVDTIDIFRILYATAIIQPTVSLSGLVLISLGKSKRYFKIGCIYGIVIVASFFIGLPWGAIGVALSYTIINYITAVPLLYLTVRQTPITISQFLNSTKIPFLCSLIMGIVVSAVKYTVVFQNSFVNISLYGAIAILIFFMSFYFSSDGRRNLGVLKNQLKAHLKVS